MDDKQDENKPKQEDTEMAAVEKKPTPLRQQLSNAERKTIIRSATEKAFDEYDDVFKKLSKN